MKFLPGVFMDAMRDNPEAAVHIFEGTHENPELIWNDSSRERVSTTVREMMLEYVALQYMLDFVSTPLILLLMFSLSFVLKAL